MEKRRLTAPVQDASPAMDKQNRRDSPDRVRLTRLFRELDNYFGAPSAPQLLADAEKRPQAARRKGVTRLWRVFSRVFSRWIR